MASEQLKKVLDIAKLQQIGGASEPTIEQLRAGIEKVAERVASDVHCEPVMAGDVQAEWIVPPEADAERTLLYFHGGGYVMGSINTHRAMVARMARAARARALAIDYRLAPEHPFPAAVEDATAAYRWLLAQGYKPHKIALAGDSAGGGLTLTTLLALRDAQTPLPACAVPISPWTDAEGTGASVKTKAAKDPMVREADLLRYGKLYGGNTDLKNPLISPLYGDYRGIPPVLIQVGEAEIILDDSTRVAERAKQAGVQVDLEVWDEMVHVWHIFAKLLPEAQQAIEKLGAYVIAHTP
ncbi:MAG: alpha/beta hydrolase [Candidatus Binatia bacterium]